MTYLFSTTATLMIRGRHSIAWLVRTASTISLATSSCSSKGSNHGNLQTRYDKALSEKQLQQVVKV